MKTWDLAKKSDFTPFLSSGTENENFLHTMIIYIENETHGEILRKNVDSLFKLTQSTTVNKSKIAHILVKIGFFKKIPKGFGQKIAENRL